MILIQGLRRNPQIFNLRTAEIIPDASVRVGISLGVPDVPTHLPQRLKAAGIIGGHFQYHKRLRSRRSIHETRQVEIGIRPVETNYRLAIENVGHINRSVIDIVLGRVVVPATTIGPLADRRTIRQAGNPIGLQP